MINLNGKLLEASKARIEPTDRGLTLGDGLFETILVQGRQPMRVGAHLARLRNGASILDIPLASANHALMDLLLETLQANSLSEGSLRLTLTRGPAPRGLAPPTHPSPTLLITASKEPSPDMAPLAAIIATITRRNEHSPLSRCKCLNRLDDVLARKEAIKRGANEAILLNTAGRLAEAAAANLFLAIEGELATPPVDEGALPGVMRAEIMAANRVVERPLTPKDLAGATEAFISNSLGIRPLASINGIPVGGGQPGPAFKKVFKKLNAG